MEIEKTINGIKATIPLITEDEMKKINVDFDNIINKFLDMIIKDKDLAIAQYIIKKQKEQINQLKRNSIPKKKIEDKKEENTKLFFETKDVRYANRYALLKELLEE